ncbi:MAG: hypothetical protein LBB72_03675 [Spirochaetaceae bacterium]|jgi:hypothetical protein|nr:hypothetical protein [Spirochaetaceae bacterium]
MKKLVFYKGLAALAAAAILLFSACGNPAGNGPNGPSGGSGLTITNLPGGGTYAVYVFASGTDISTYTAIVNAYTSGSYQAVGTASSGGVFTLNGWNGTSQTSTWTGSGNLPVLLLNSSGSISSSENPVYSYATVNFSNGSGTASFSGFTAVVYGGVGPGDGGTLTIINLPEGVDYAVGVYNYSGEISDLLEWALVASDIVAAGMGTASSSMTLYSASTAEVFDGTGSYMVALYTTSMPITVLYQTGVSFTDGSAVIDYDNMTDLLGNAVVGPGGGGTKGKLSINNLPEGVDYAVGVYNYSGEISDLLEWALVASDIVAAGMGTASSSMILYSASTASAFTGTGSYMVALYTTSIPITVLYQTGVSFTDGSAVIDYDNMTDLLGNAVVVPGGGGGNGRGTLTIANFPTDTSLIITVFDYDGEITNLMDFATIQADFTKRLAIPSGGMASSSPVSLRKATNPLSAFDGTGTYLVMLNNLATLTTWYADQVEFTNGCAELDFNTLRLMSDLPLTNNDYLQSLILNKEDFGDTAVVTRTFSVSSTEEMSNAVNIINNGGNDKNYVINVTEDFSTNGFNFGTEGLKISIRGDKTITLLDDSGPMALWGGGEQNNILILRDIDFKGRKIGVDGADSNSGHVVTIFDNGVLIMRGSASVYGSGSGGILFHGNYYHYYSGTLIMQDDSSVYGNNGTGVEGGTVIMDDNASVHDNDFIGVSVSNLTMRGNSSVHSNTVTAGYWDTIGCGVCYGETFIMQDNASVYGNTVNKHTNERYTSTVYGVGVNGGIFTMRDNASVHSNTINLFGNGPIDIGGMGYRALQLICGATHQYIIRESLKTLAKI